MSTVKNKKEIPNLQAALGKKEDMNHRMIVPTSDQGITKEKLERFMPKGTSIKVTEEILETIRNMENDTDLPQNLMEESLMSYMHLIGNRQGTGLDDLVKAVKFCQLQRFMNNSQAWEIVFPDKANERRLEGKGIDQFASMYNTRSVLVTAINKQMLVPFKLQYSAHGDEAMNITMNLARGIAVDGKPVSHMVQHLCAKTIIDNTKIEEDQTIQLKVGLTDDAKESRDRMANQMAVTAEAIQQAVRNGANITDIQALNLSHDDGVDTTDDYEDADYIDSGDE